MENYTVYKAIIHDSGDFELSTIKYHGEWLKELMLTWDPMKKKDLDVWDGHKYIVSMYKQLKNKRKGKKISAFREACEKYGLEYESTREDFILMMKEAKKEGMWE